MNYKMKYEAECKRILQTYPEQMKKVFSYPDCELESDFLGFVDEYAEEQIPEDFTVIDFGCYQAVQACYFEHCKKYIGIDNSAPIEYRFPTQNAEYYNTTIQNFIKKIMPTMQLDLNKVYAICSYVPDEEAQKLVADTFPYAKIVYSNEKIANRKPPVLNFYNCLYLLGELADHNLIKYDPNDHDRVLVYREATKDNPAGWYSENIHTIAQELVNDGNNQIFLLEVYEDQLGHPYTQRSYKADLYDKEDYERD